jgi:peptidoglycan/LPS O-acetylase OafA/YrhL
MGLARLFLALIVAADHWRVIQLAPLGITFEDFYKLGFNSGYAVMFFYVISGFLITFTLTRNYARDLGGVLDFYRNRFIRIFSLYWPMVLLSFLLIPGVWTEFVDAGFWDKTTGLFLVGMDWRLAFASYPQTHWPAAIGALHQAWTLGAEVTFYLLAPLLLRSWRVAAAVLFASFGLRAIFVLSMGFSDIWTYHFVRTTFGFFLLGHLTCLGGRRFPILANSGLGTLLLAGSLLAMTFGGSYRSFDGTRFWTSVLLFTLALPGLFEATKGVRWMNLVGDLSYPIYLVHTAVLILLEPWLMRVALPSITTIGGYVSIGSFLVATILAAILVHCLCEVPTARLMRMIRLPRPQLGT